MSQTTATEDPQAPQERLEPGAPGPEEPTPPEPQPPAPPDGEKPNRRSRRPASTNGHYMVIAAHAGGRDHEPAFREVGWFKAHGADHAKRQAIADAEAGHDDWLKRAIHADHGVILRAVPALNWPKTDPSGYKVTKRLEIN